MRNCHTIIGLAIVLALAAANPAGVRGQGEALTYRVILYLAEQGAPQQIQIQRLGEVWSAEDGAQRLQSLLESGLSASSRRSRWCRARRRRPSVSATSPSG